MASVFRSIIVETCRSAVREARLIDLEHRGMEGAIRETLHRRLIAPVIPPDTGLGTGKLISHQGHASPQIDTIIYGNAILPSIFYENHGIFPVEACLYAIEVKTRLRNSDVRSAVENARSIKRLPMLPSRFYRRKGDSPHMEETVLPMAFPILSLFAFASDLTSDPISELRRYYSIDPEADSNPAITTICIAGRGYWHHREDGWHFVAPSNDLDEVVQFLAGLTNTLPSFLAAKGRPHFGPYLGDGSVQHAKVSSADVAQPTSRTAYAPRNPSISGKIGHGPFSSVLPRFNEAVRKPSADCRANAYLY